MTGRNPDWQLGCSEAELAAMTRDLDEAHRATTPVMRAEAAEFGTVLREQIGTHRRGFLLGLGAIGAGLAMAAAGGDRVGRISQAAFTRDLPAGLPSTGTVAAARAAYTGDLKIVAFAAALENQAVAAYQTALKAAKAGKLGKVPAAVGTFAQTALGQHADHAAGWNKVLKNAGMPPVTGVPLSTFGKTKAALEKARNVGDVAKIALGAEEQAAATYLFAATNVSDPGGIKTAATIAPVESMHAAILHFVLGQYPVPASFLTTRQAANPATFTG